MYCMFLLNDWTLRNPSEAVTGGKRKMFEDQKKLN